MNIKKLCIGVVSVLLIGSIALCVYMDRAGRDAVITSEEAIIIYEKTED